MSAIMMLAKLANIYERVNRMTAVSIFEAKTNLSKYVSAVADRLEPYVVITRNGKPIARIVPFEEDGSKRIGLAEGRLPRLSSLEAFNSIDVGDDMMNGGRL